MNIYLYIFHFHPQARCKRQSTAVCFSFQRCFLQIWFWLTLTHQNLENKLHVASSSPPLPSDALPKRNSSSHRFREVSVIYVFNNLVWPVKDVIKIEMALIGKRFPTPGLRRIFYVCTFRFSETTIHQKTSVDSALPWAAVSIKRPEL